jgi:DNA-binding LytR/AlgR family response regulator
MNPAAILRQFGWLWPRTSWRRLLLIALAAQLTVTLLVTLTVSHFYAKDGLTFAATGSRDVVVDTPIADLERRLDPAAFLRIHRGTLVNVRFIAEAHAGFAGGMAVRLRDAKRTSLQVSRDRVREVKRRLGF